MASFKCGETGRTFRTEKELIDYMIDKDSPFLTGELATKTKSRLNVLALAESNAEKKKRYESMITRIEENE